MQTQDPIDEFIALPRDQQIATLQKLPSDKQEKLLDQVRIRRSAPTQATAPDSSSGNWFDIQNTLDRKLQDFSRPRTAADIEKQTANAPIKTPQWMHQADRSFQNVTRRFVGDLGSTAVHPIDAAKGFYDTGKELVTAPYPIPGKAGEAAMRQWDTDNQNSPIHQQLKAFQDTYKRNPREAIEGLSGDLLAMYVSGKLLDAGGNVIKPVLGPLGEKVMSLPKRTVEAVSNTGTGAIQDLVKRTAADNEASAAAAAEANKTATEKTLADRGKVDDANAKQAEADRQARLKVMRENKEAAEAHAAQREDVAAKNREALRQQEKIAPTKEKLNNASSELRARVETARENALKTGNEKYSGVNEALSHLPADMETVSEAYHDAASSIGETQAQPSVLSRMGNAIQKGEELTYGDLQQAYSELGRELSKRNLPGPTYHAYDLLHDAIGDDMQRIADSQGKGAELLDARNYWRRMKQTFGKPMSMTDNATAAIRGIDPDFLTSDTEANRLRLLGSFDKEIPKVAEHVKNLKQGVSSLPEPKPVRDVVKIPPEAPEPKSLPQGSTPKQYPEPHPTTPRVERKIGTEEIRNAKKESLADRAEKIRTRGGSYANTFVALDAIRNAIHGNFGGIATDAAARGAFGLAKHGLANLLEKPGVVDFLTKPTAADIAQIPPEMRGDIATIAKAAQNQGVKVSPILLRAVGVTSGLQHPTFTTNRYQHKAVNADGHMVGSNDGANWFDAQTGKPVASQ